MSSIYEIAKGVQIESEKFMLSDPFMADANKVATALIEALERLSSVCVNAEAKGVGFVHNDISIRRARELLSKIEGRDGG